MVWILKPLDLINGLAQGYNQPFPEVLMNNVIILLIAGVSPITLYLGVKFYAADPCKLVEEITRKINNLII